MNLRELFHFTQLRGAPNGHFAYRRIALKAYEIAKDVYPAFAPFMRCEKYPSSRDRAGGARGVNGMACADRTAAHAGPWQTRFPRNRITAAKISESVSDARLRRNHDGEMRSETTSRCRCHSPKPSPDNLAPAPIARPRSPVARLRPAAARLRPHTNLRYNPPGWCHNHRHSGVTRLRENRRAAVAAIGHQHRKQFFVCQLFGHLERDVPLRSMRPQEARQRSHSA